MPNITYTDDPNGGGGALGTAVATAQSTADAAAAAAAAAQLDADTNAAAISALPELLDEDDFASNSDTQSPTQQSSRVFTRATALAAVDSAGSTLARTIRDRQQVSTEQTLVVHSATQKDVWVPDGSTGNFNRYQFELNPSGMWTMRQILVYNNAKNTLLQALMGNDAGYAFNIRPVGATNFQFVGSDHENEIASSVVIETDDRTVDLSATTGSTSVSRDVVFESTGVIRHPDTGTTDIANITSTFRVGQSGVDQMVTIDWLVASEVSTAYVAMVPMADSLCDRVTFAGEGVIDSEGLATGVRSTPSERLVAVYFDTGHDYVQMIQVADFTSVGNWVPDDSTHLKAHVQGTIFGSKIYFDRTGVSSISASDEWRCRWSYVPAYLPRFSDFVG